MPESKMSSSFSIVKCLVSVPILAVVAMQLLPIHFVLSLNQTNAYLHHECINNQGTYKSGSPYEESVNKAVEWTIKNILIYGFVEAVMGQEPDTVYFKVQCRGDLSVPQCRSCVTTAVSAVRKRCPKNRGSIIWYDFCVLEITSVDRGKLDYQNYFYLYNTKDVSGNKESFNRKTSALLNSLKEKATKEKSHFGKNFLYATGEESLGTSKLYAMMQCTKDLTRNNCSMCLKGIIAKLPKCCNGRQGGRVLCTNCNFRYELYPFVKPLVNGSSV